MVEFKNQRNPILPLKYHVPDCEAHRMPDGKLYLYGSYDDLDTAYCSQEYHVISTGDMETWTIGEEPSFHTKEIPWMDAPDSPRYPGVDWYHPTPFLQKMIQNIIEAQKEKQEEIKAGDLESADAAQSGQDVGGQALLFAPDCISCNGKYYLYFCLSDDREGVAVSDSPQGPFHDAVQFPCGGIDPAVFIDDDGQAYYYWGQIYAKGVKLNEDMMSFDPEQIVENLVTEEEHHFHEGSSMRKIGDTYYFVYADVERGKPTSLGYATAKSPLGPFAYQGILIDNDGCDPKSWNNHGSIECMDGQWYIFYHRSSRNTDKNRRLCVEKIHINPDGTIDEVKMTSQGIGKPFAPGEEIMGYQACGLKGAVYIEVDTAYGYEEKLTHISDGDEMVFRYVKSETPWTRMELTCGGSGKIEVCLNENAVGTTAFSGAAGKKQVINVPISMAAGEYELKLRIAKSQDLEILSVVLW